MKSHCPAVQTTLKYNISKYLHKGTTGVHRKEVTVPLSYCCPNVLKRVERSNFERPREIAGYFDKRPLLNTLRRDSVGIGAIVTPQRITETDKMKTIVLLDYGVSKLLGAHCITVAAKMLVGSVI